MKEGRRVQNMKRILWMILVALILVPTTSYAAKQKTTKKGSLSTHNVAFWGGLGYSSMLNDAEQADLVGGAGGVLGVGYELRRKQFKLYVGPEFRIFGSRDNLNMPVYDVQRISANVPQVKHYTFTKLLERQAVGQVMLPVMLGGEFDYVYFLVGGKVGYTVLGQYNQKGLLTTTLTDPMAYDKAWTNMPSQGLFTDQKYTQKGKNPFGLDATVSAEIGVVIDKLMSQEWQEANEKREHPWHMRASLFVDYGLPNLYKGNSSEIATADEIAIATNSLMQSNWTSHVNSLLVGVKFTALLQMNKPRLSKKEWPTMTFETFDIESKKALSGVQLTITGDNLKKPKVVTTNGKAKGKSKLDEGEYHIAAKKNYYRSCDTAVVHTVGGSQLRIGLKYIPPFRFYVVDDSTGQRISAKVTLTEKQSNKQFASLSGDTLSGAGQVRMPVETTYIIHIEKDGYFSYTGEVQHSDSIQGFALKPIEKKKAIILHNLFFATNQTKILPESEQALSDLYTLLSENPSIRVRITGHTDNVGSDDDNQRLSEGRAESVRQEMIDRGIDPERMEAVGKGESEPIDTNDTEEGRQNNRRVELNVL